MNDPVFLVIDLVIIALVSLVVHYLRQIARNTRKPHFSSECCDERERP